MVVGQEKPGMGAASCFRIVSAGLGYFILDTRDRLAYSELMAAILIIGALGFALDHLARWVHARWLHR